MGNTVVYHYVLNQSPSYTSTHHERVTTYEELHDTQLVVETVVFGVTRGHYLDGTKCVT